MKFPLQYLLIFLGIFIVYIIYIYNRLVNLRNRCREAASDIEVQLKKRFDLIPNLLETVKGYMGHEAKVLKDVTEARTKFLQAQTSGDTKGQVESHNFLDQTLKTLFAVAESYPELKANVNFLELQKELRDIEDKIQAARRFYNAVVQEYNNFLEYFPNNIFASLFRFKPFEFFDIPTEEEQKVEVKF